jgi:acetyl-CoA acetyltransferase
MTVPPQPTEVRPDKELSCGAAIVGLGETAYGEDYRASRAKDPDYVPATVATLAARAFDRALDDSGIGPGEVDGLSFSCIYGGVEPEAFCRDLGLEPRYLIEAAGLRPIPAATEALASRACDTLALVFAVAPRSARRQFGGETYRGNAPTSYYYYHPWGWSSQAAHWALMFQYYMTTYGATEEDLGAVALSLRDNASRNENAIMRAALTLEDYLASRYVVAPIRLFDMCLVNDGAVCLILRRPGSAGDGLHPEVLVAGWGHAQVHHSAMHYLVREGLHPQLRTAGERALEMAGLARGDIQHFQGYDASSIYLAHQLEGYGFAEPGEALSLFKEGRFALGGSLPVNTSGGLLSESYMMGWNLVAEAVRQLRQEAGNRQVGGLETSMFSFATTESAHPIIFKRGR